MGAKSSRNTTQNNRSDGHLLEYFRNTFIRGGGGTNTTPNFGSPLGLSATGGVISDYIDPTPGAVYRAHIFTSTGTFTVSSIGSYGSNVEYLVVAGGGGGGSAGGGGGAGGFRTNVPGTTHSTSVAFPVNPGSFPAPFSVFVGAGGAGTAAVYPSTGGTGTDSSFGPITSNGGGGGASGASGGPAPGVGGGSGGGAGRDSGSSPGGSSTSVTTPSPWPGPSTQGNVGGSGYPGGGGGQTAGGGGGAGGAGIAGGRYDISNPATYSQGGAGIPMNITGITTHYAGGGGGGQYPGPTIPSTDVRIGGSGVGGSGGNTTGSPPIISATNGVFSTGSGGGGSGGPSSGGVLAANGGSGIVVVRYQIGQLTAAQKATGGAISYYNGKTIHTFTTSGTFQTLSNWSATNVEYVVIGGGASGGACGASQGGGGGGGGAGGYLTNTNHPIGTHPVSVSVVVGAGGASPKTPGNNHGTVGTPSYFGVPLTAPTGGYGAMADGSPKTGGGPGASGGGGGGGGSTGTNANPGPATGAPFPGTIGVSPTSGWGHAGGSGVSGGQGYSGGGGGGAGSAGVSGTFGTNGKGGNGGLGMQLPSTFRNPLSTVGHPGPTSPPFTGADTSGLYWFAGGGGGGINPQGGGTPVQGYGGVGPGATTSPFAGAGNAGKDAPGSNALENSGSGGGGSGGDSAGYSGNGGSGIVLIAYPS